MAKLARCEQYLLSLAPKPAFFISCRVVRHNASQDSGSIFSWHERPITVRNSRGVLICQAGFVATGGKTRGFGTSRRAALLTRVRVSLGAIAPRQGPKPSGMVYCDALRNR